MPVRRPAAVGAILVFSGLHSDTSTPSQVFKGSPRHVSQISSEPVCTKLSVCHSRVELQGAGSIEGSFRADAPTGALRLRVLRAPLGHSSGRSARIARLSRSHCLAIVAWGASVR